MTFFNLKPVAPTWRPILEKALDSLSPEYKQFLSNEEKWLPGSDQIFNAFSQPLEQTKYILFGESPYPRQQSANGYAFWDAAVGPIWSENGFTKTVNRATSLRNFIKMLLVADNALDPTKTKTEDVAKVDHSKYIQTIDQLFTNLLNNGFLLLNASLVLSSKPVSYDAKAWFPFLSTLLTELSEIQQPIQLILWGNIAKKINQIEAVQKFPQINCEHPYNLTFINNIKMLNYFRKFKLLTENYS